MGKRGKAKARTDREDESEQENPVIFLSSSDDDVANEDLTLEIVERARKREAKRKKLEKEDGFDSFGSVQIPVVDLSTSSSEDVEGVLPVEEKKKRKKKPKKKKKIEEGGVVDELAKEEEPFGLAESVATKVNEACDNAVCRKLLVDELAKEEDPLGLADSVATKVNEACDSAVFRKLLRGPRYFDLGENIWEICYNCGEEGHKAVNCTVEKPQKPCFVCGMFGHIAKQCTQGHNCFICKRRGHLAKDCPDKHRGSPKDCKICLRCGDLGHDMLSCRNNYAPDDLKDIQCYTCKKVGHLCCVDFTDAYMREVSCYNCAQSGHSGLGCARSRGETSAVASPTLCYKCGQEGHFARGCIQITKPRHWLGESSAPPRRFAKESRESMGFRSMPYDFAKARKQKNVQCEGGRNMTAGWAKAKGGWIVDDPGDLPQRKPKANGWKSPTTPLKKRHEIYSLASDSRYSSSQSPIKKNKPFLGIHNSHVSKGTFQHGFSASRFGKSQSRFGRS